MEMMVGGERYEMVPLPDAMVDTTLFVGNLCEFAHDQDLSLLFQAVSILNHVPACVVRKPNSASLQYGFVSFLTVEEKMAAILRFDGSEWRGRCIKVESICDDKSCGRVRVPERLVSYVSGRVKKTPDGRTNALRRISRDDVERLSRGQPAKRKGSGSRGVPHRLDEVERQELNRASKRGYLTLNGSGYRRSRKGSPLANIHRQWCDARDKPQILLSKASGSLPDCVVVDLSPLRLHGVLDDPAAAAEEFMVRWKTQILAAASNAGMKLRNSATNDSAGTAADDKEQTENDPICQNDDDDERDDDDDDDDNESNDKKEEECIDFTVHKLTLDANAWAKEPIWKLPVVSIGVFEGDRPQAKAMAKELAELWNIPEVQQAASSGIEGGDRNGPLSRRAAGARHGGRTKTKGLGQHHRQQQQQQQRRNHDHSDW